MSGPQRTVKVPVVEEQLQVGRRTVESGAAVRLRKEVREEPAAFEQALAHEVVETRRLPVDKVIDAPVGVRQEGSVTIVPVLAERVVTRTELVLVEEIHIHRRTEVRHHTGEVPVRREHVVIERRDAATGQWVAEEEEER